MNEPTPTKPQRKLTSLELSAPARGALRRLKKKSGMSFTFAVETALSLLERSVALDPLDDAARAGLGLKPAASVKRNRRKPVVDRAAVDRVATAHDRKGGAR